MLRLNASKPIYKKILNRTTMLLRRVRMPWLRHQQHWALSRSLGYIGQGVVQREYGWCWRRQYMLWSRCLAGVAARGSGDQCALVLGHSFVCRGEGVQRWRRRHTSLTWSTLAFFFLCCIKWFLCFIKCFFMLKNPLVKIYELWCCIYWVWILLLSFFFNVTLKWVCVWRLHYFHITTSQIWCYNYLLECVVAAESFQPKCCIKHSYML